MSKAQPSGLLIQELLKRVTPAQIDAVAHTFDGNFDHQRRVPVMRN